MKTLLKLSIFTTSIVLISLQCTDNKNKPKNVILKEEVYISYDSSTIIDDIESITWYFKTINNESISKYTDEPTSPFMLFSIDTSFILINSGCNIYIGECTIHPNDKIHFDRIRLKEEICPINALEREIIYMLDITDKYSLYNDTLLLYNKNNLIGVLSTNK